MQIVKPYAKILGVPDRDYGIMLLQRIEWSARISHRSEESQDAESWERMIKAVVIDHGDWSVVEHATVMVDMLVDRGITHELVRHRLFSFTQESTRFCNYKKKGEGISFIMPEFDLMAESVATPCEVAWRRAVANAEQEYLLMLEHGASPQIARSVLPNSLASRIIVTGNLRNWRHFLIMRTTRETHPQMRQVAIPLLQEFKEKIPLLFDDLEPMAKQSENMKRAR